MQPTKLVIKVNEDVSSRDLHKRVISRPQKDDVLFVQVLKESISQDFVDLFPVACDQALLVQIDEVALNLLLIVIHLATVLEVVSDLVAMDLLEGVAESLQLLQFSLAQKFFNDFRKEINVAVCIVKLVLLLG